MTTNNSPYEVHSWLGATLQAPQGVAYRVWAPDISHIQVDIHSVEGETRKLPLQRDSKEGYHMGLDEKGRAGDAYFYQLEGKGNFPDPASRAQQDNVHGRSLVVDPAQYIWQDNHWCRPSFRDLVIYELHIGTFTENGTFQSACTRLKALHDLGITAIEIMPIADFPGTRNWGYDGVLPYAPARCYGSPDDLRRLVDCAHAEGLTVILDVVYNHFGPSGNYLTHFTPRYFNSQRRTPWGDAFHFDGELSAPVREFFVQNPLYWMKEFHIDGFRLDATHAIFDNSQPPQQHILAEICAAIHKRGGYALAEDERNASYLIEPLSKGGIGFDGVWADDFHHVLRVSQTQEKASYFANYKGSLSEILSTLHAGWLYSGQKALTSGMPYGTKCEHLPPQKLIHCISNHDQTGNNALGKRLSQIISPAAYRMLSALLCLSPYTPLIFMGQEWGASTPFLYFTDHELDLGKKVTEGRRKEFAEFPEFAEPEAQKYIPDPQAETTFFHSKLQWQERGQDEHAKIFLLYQECLRLRREIPALRPQDRKSWHVTALPWGAGQIHYEIPGGEYLLIFDPFGHHAGPLPKGGESNWTPLLSTEEERFGGNKLIKFSSEKIAFEEKGLIFLQRFSL